MQKSLYANSARFYDKGNEMKGFISDIGFYKSYIDDTTRVLELGCGTGRITLSLIDKCKQITGVELSDQMLDILRGKVEKLDEYSQSRINLVKADMSNFNLNEKFDLIIFPGITFQALTTNNQRNSCLDCVKRHLTDNGKVIIDFFEPDIEKVKKVGNRRFDFEYFDEDLNCTVSKYSVIENHDSVNQIQMFKYTFELSREGTGIDIIDDYFELGYLYPEQIKELFSSNKLTIDALYSWYDFSEIDINNKDMLIYVLSKECQGRGEI
jgi:ubiquinone/menaquinone biosynthesis C-methylase UbiE